MRELIYNLRPFEDRILEKGHLIYEDMVRAGRIQTGWAKTRGRLRFIQGVKGEWAICIYRGVDPWQEIKHENADLHLDGIICGWRYDAKFTPHVCGRLAYNPNNTNHDLTKTDLWILVRPIVCFDGWVVRVEGYIPTKHIPQYLEAIDGGEGGLHGVNVKSLNHLDMLYSARGIECPT